MMSKADLARRVGAGCRLTGRFVLRSGRVATEYFDKYQFEADPVLLDDLASSMAPLVPPETEVLAGLEMGGIAVVTAPGRQRSPRVGCASWGPGSTTPCASSIGRRAARRPWPRTGSASSRS